MQNTVENYDFNKHYNQHKSNDETILTLLET